MSDTETVEPVKKQRPGTFSSTHQPKHRRTADRIPHNVKADVVAGLAAHGEDGNGKGGFRGFVKYLAGRHPKQAARLIERLLPPSVVISNSHSSLHAPTINVVSIPSGTFLSEAEMQKAQSGTLLHGHVLQPQLQQLEQLAELCESSEPEPDFVPRTETEQQLRAQLESLSEEQLRELAKRVGCDVDSG